MTASILDIIALMWSGLVLGFILMALLKIREIRQLRKNDLYKRWNIIVEKKGWKGYTLNEFDAFRIGYILCIDEMEGMKDS